MDFDLKHFLKLAGVVWLVWDTVRVCIFVLVWMVAPGSDFAIALLQSLIIKSMLGPLAIVVHVAPYGIEWLTMLVTTGGLAFIYWRDNY
ncbi:MAG: hypothetical protein WDA16_13765 [Candidatus Thermoplasmatota archaeon]